MARPRLIIAGAGGFGREVLSWALDAEAAGADWEVAGFLDDDPRALDGFEAARPLLGRLDAYQADRGDRLTCAIGEPRLRLEVCRALQARGGRFVSLVHPTALVGRGSTLGQGCILCPGAVLTANVRLGDFVVLNVHASVGHDAVLGDGCVLSAHVDVTGRARLGTGVLLGSHAVVLPGADVGDFAVVGAGSVVLRHVPPGASVLGVPARRVAGFDRER